jgi:hypothetical protein
MGDVVLVEEMSCLRDAPSLPLFFVSAESKDVTGGMSVSADSAGVKVAAFPMSWEWRVSADSKGFMGASCL